MSAKDILTDVVDDIDEEGAERVLNLILQFARDVICQCGDLDCPVMIASSGSPDWKKLEEYFDPFYGVEGKS